MWSLQVMKIFAALLNKLEPMASENKLLYSRFVNTLIHILRIPIEMLFRLEFGLTKFWQ